MSIQAIVLLVFISACVLAGAFPALWRWIALAGIAGGLAWWSWTLSGGCDEASEVRCGWQPVLTWLQAALLVVVWLAGIVLGWVGRRKLKRKMG